MKELVYLLQDTYRMKTKKRLFNIIWIILMKPDPSGKMK